MTRHTLPFYSAVAAKILLVLLVSVSFSETAFGVPAQQTTSGVAEDPIQALAKKIEELNATIQELRSEISQSRQENREIREELRRARDAGVSINSNAGQKEQTTTADQLGQIEENQQLLADKIDEQYQTKVESASRYRMRLSGMVLFNAFANRGRVDNQDVPNIALPRGPTDTGGDFGSTFRQSQLGFEVYGPAVGGARASADLRLDFFGGFPTTANGTTAHCSEPFARWFSHCLWESLDLRFFSDIWDLSESFFSKLVRANDKKGRFSAGADSSIFLLLCTKTNVRVLS